MEELKKETIITDETFEDFRQKWERLKTSTSDNVVKQECPVMSFTVNVSQDNYSDDLEILKRTMKSTDLCSFIYSFENELRKLQDEEFDENKLEILIDRWYELKSDNGINLDEIYS